MQATSAFRSWRHRPFPPEPRHEWAGQHRDLQAGVGEPSALRVQDRVKPVNPERAERQADDDEGGEANPPAPSPGPEQREREEAWLDQDQDTGPGVDDAERQGGNGPDDRIP